MKIQFNHSTVELLGNRFFLLQGFRELFKALMICCQLRL